MPNIHFMYHFQLAYYGLGTKFRTGASSIWELPGENNFMEECADFTKILDSGGHDNEKKERRRRR